MNLENLPIILGSFVAVVSAIISLYKLLIENSASSRKIKRLSEITDVYVKLPSNSSARSVVDKIITFESNNIYKILTRKVNVANVFVVLLVSGLGGFVSYWLALWAANSGGFWSVVAWVLFAGVAFFTIGIAIAGLASIYQQDESKGNNK